MSIFVSGTQEVINRILLERDKMLRDVSVAVEKTSVDVANHAKAGHESNAAHMNQRYQNQTSNLTNSITQELEKVSYDEVSAVVFTTMEYAPYVEMGPRAFPFLWPALLGNLENLKRRVSTALHR